MPSVTFRGRFPAAGRPAKRYSRRPVPHNEPGSQWLRSWRAAELAEWSGTEAAGTGSEALRGLLEGSGNEDQLKQRGGLGNFTVVKTEVAFTAELDAQGFCVCGKFAQTCRY